MKKIISLILATISMVFSNVTVSAIETNYSQQTQLSYTYEGDYMIYIPMEIDVGENISVMVDNVNILSSKKIVVSVGNFDYDNRIVLTNSNCESYAYAILKDTNGNQITTSNNIIGEFTNDSHSGKEISTEVCCENTLTAGTYTGWVDFYIELTNI